jgi:hypothetical protein
MLKNLFSADYFAKKTQARINRMKPEDFEPYEEARERYIETKLEPMLDLYRQGDHASFKDFQRRKGEAMHSSDLIFRVQKLNAHISVQQQYNFADEWGLYTENLGRVQFLTGLPKGWLTEFSYAIVNERDLPLEERRGWRTVIVYCLHKGALDWEAVLKEFGDPTDGLNDTRWQEATAEFRTGGDTISQRNIANSLE